MLLRELRYFFLAFLGKVLIFIYGLDLLDSCFV